MAIALVLAIVAVVALDPNRSWMKRHVQAWVLSQTGLEVDYGWIHVHPLSGVEVDDLVVRTPPELRAVAPDLMRAARLDVGWSLSSLLGDGPRVEGVTLSDASVTVVVDEQGRTSLDAIPSPKIPPSQWAGRFLASAPVTGRLDVERADVELLWTQAGRVVRREQLHGLGATLTCTPAAEGWRVRADVGSSAEPLDVQWTEEHDGSRSARGALALAAVLTSSRLDVALDLGLREQSFASGVELGNWHAAASARFEPDAGRTTVRVERAMSPAGGITVEGSIDVPDRGAPFVRHAHGMIDVEQLLAWIPAGLLPATAEGGALQLDIESAFLDPLPRLSAQGIVRVDADLTNVRIPTASGTIDVARAHGMLGARPVHGAVAVHGWLDAASVESADVDVHDLAIDVDGERADDGALSGRVDFHFGELQERSGGLVAIARDGQCNAHLDGLLLGSQARAIEANASAMVEILSEGKRLVGRAPAHVTLDLRDVFVDAAPIASRGTVQASIEVGNSTVFLEAVKHADSIDYSLRAVAPNLQMLRPFVSRQWNAMGIDVRSTGRIERIASREPLLRQDMAATVDRPAFRNVSARSLSLTLHSDGTASRHEATANVRVPALVIDGTPASDDALTLAASWDRRSFHVKTHADGRAEAEVEVSAKLDGGAVVYDLSSQLSKLADLAPLAARVHALDGLDLSRLELAVAAHGTLLGVVSAVDGHIELTPNPWRTAEIEGAADVSVANVSWNRPDVALVVPAAFWHGEMHLDRVIVMHSDITSVRLGLGRHQIDLAGISDDTTATVSGDLLNPAVDLTQRASIRNVEQDFVTLYPATSATIAMALRREPEGLVRISNLHVEGSAGTTLDLRGGLDLAARRSRKLSIVADLVQDLQPLSFVPKRFSGRGKVKIAATLESPNLSFFRTHLDVTATGVDVRVPGIDARAVDAEIPISMDFDVDERGARIRRETNNRYAMLRFADQLPLLRHTGYFSIGRLSTPHFEMAPFVGNLAVEQNVVSLRQFEMGVRGGWLSGDGSLDWNGSRSNVEAHLRASGVQSTYGEPFDGNMAVVLSMSDRSIEGRVEILRMGKRHLLDVLDVTDPQHVDSATNTIRSALAFGYPSRVHVGFSNGFADAHVELDGLARFVHFDDIRGVSTGLLVDRLVKAAFDARRTR
jgi:hypothetical protein